LAADLFSLIQKWNTHHLGVQLLNTIMSMTLPVLKVVLTLCHHKTRAAMLSTMTPLLL